MGRTLKKDRAYRLQYVKTHCMLQSQMDIARALDISRTTVWRYFKELGIDPRRLPSFKGRPRKQQ